MQEHLLGLQREPAHDLVVIGGSKGGLDALHTLVAALPASFAGAIAVVQHRMNSHREMLCELLRTVRRRGGIVIAQDPATAVCPEMPLHAIATGVVDHVLPLERIGAMLIERVSRSLSGVPAAQ